MRLRLDDLAVFVAGWDPKPDQVRTIAKTLDLGLDALVFVDDNPIEREAMRQLCPEVDVVTLPDEPALFARALSQYLLFETPALTGEDARRTEQYRARAGAAALEASATTLEEFLESLEMEATITPVAEADLERVVQLLGKTNQFNVTSRRHSRGQVERLVADPANLHLTLRLRDRFADHGLVGVILAVGRGAELDIDTWLMSCRVLGRTAEQAMLSVLTAWALSADYRTVRGTYVPTAKNAIVADLFERSGFRAAGDDRGVTTWEYDLATQGPVESPYIAIRQGEPA
jgi:FkbH-like protein